ncbi:unnamed protein product [Allacma fusca]|uniref:Chitin-binding type-4 domain-containing protein n=1 Tax=Allacma fusca TaxID=39272 RepID=A0A8J2PII1_9HEXA|nr:unnamed protein product [Allacma fusca]
MGILYLPDPIHSHGRLLDPPSRSSLWRFEEYRKYKPVVNTEDNQLYCGGYEVQHGQNGGKCGICGDPYNQSKPRDNEDGGIYDLGIVTRTFRAGQIIPVDVELTASHWGYWELRLCPNTPVTQECLDSHLLTFAGTPYTRYWVSHHPDHHGPKYYSVSVKLPSNLRCKKCVLQWHYHTGTRWGNCGDGTEALGCGPQETFRGCADIAIE